MKKNDIILVALLLLLAGAAYLAISLYQNSTTGKQGVAVVYIDGKKKAEYPLNKDTEVKIELENGKYNLLEIKDGYADVTDASCPDGICVKHRKINKNGQTIVCLPNKLVVQIENGLENDLDGVS